MASIPRSHRHAFVSTLAGLLLCRALPGCGGSPSGTEGAENAPRDETASADPAGPHAAGSDATGTAADDVEAARRGHRAGEDAGPGQGSATTFDWVAGDYPPDLHEQTYLEISGVPGQPGKTRQYKVHVPKSYRPAAPAPVLFAFHGYTQNAVQFVVDSTTFVAKSEQDGFILVMPNGLQEDYSIGGSWNAGTCCGEAAAQKVDDVALVRAIYAAVRTHLNVDTSRVYATGLSNGGYISHRLGCEAADIFVAIAPLGAAIGTAELGPWLDSEPDPDLKRCEPVRPVAVLAMHGDADPIVPNPGMKASLDHWAAKDGCGTDTMAATLPASGGDTTCLTYLDCPKGIELTGCTVKGGGHCWFGDPSGSCGTGFPGIGNLFVGNDSDFLNATDAAWAFLKRFRR